jgi:hypothetical protein
MTMLGGQVQFNARPSLRNVAKSGEMRERQQRLYVVRFGEGKEKKRKTNDDSMVVLVLSRMDNAMGKSGLGRSRKRLAAGGLPCTLARPLVRKVPVLLKCM